MTSSLLAVEDTLRAVAGGISNYLVEGEQEVVDTPRLQMAVSKVDSSDIGGSVQSAGASSVKIPAGVDYGECVVVLV